MNSNGKLNREQSTRGAVLRIGMILSYDLLDLDAEVEPALPVGHLEVLAVAAGASGHGVQLLLRHNHHSPVLGRVERLEVVYHSARRILRVALFTERTDQELLAALDKIVGHVHLLLDMEKCIRFLWRRNAAIGDGTLVEQ